MIKNNSISEDDVALAAKLKRVPPELALAIWQQESSSGKNATTSPRGAVGGFQVTPDTFKRYLPGGDINDPVDNMQAGLSVLRDGLDKSGGDPEGAAQFYYHGRILPDGVEGPDSGPGTPTVRQYGKQVVGKAKQIASRRNGFQSLAVAPGNQTSTAPQTTVPDNLTAALFGNGLPDDEEDQPTEIEGDYDVDDEEEGDQAVPNMPGLTGPLNPVAYGGMNDMASNQAGLDSYDLDKYIRSLVDQELKT